MSEQHTPANTGSTNLANAKLEKTAQLFHRLALASLIALIILCLAWEWFLAPLRPGGSWMVLKAVFLLIPLRGVLKRDIYTMQWSSMVILLYFTEGVVRGASDTLPLSAALAWTEAGLVTAYFLACIFYIRPYKIAAKASAKAALAKAAANAEKAPPAANHE